MPRHPHEIARGIAYEETGAEDWSDALDKGLI